MNVFLVAYIYRPSFLDLVQDGDMNIYKYKMCMFKNHLFVFELIGKLVFVGKSRLCKMTGAKDDVEFVCNTFLVDIAHQERSSLDVAIPERSSSEYIYIPGFEITRFQTKDIIANFIFAMGNNVIPNTKTFGKRNK